MTRLTLASVLRRATRPASHLRAPVSRSCWSSSPCGSAARRDDYCQVSMSTHGDPFHTRGLRTAQSAPCGQTTAGIYHVQSGRDTYRGSLPTYPLVKIHRSNSSVPQRRFSDDTVAITDCQPSYTSRKIVTASWWTCIMPPEIRIFTTPFGVLSARSDALSSEIKL